MNEKEPTFYEFVYDTFYKLADKTPENVSLLFSRKIEYPTIKLIPEVEITIPLPKMQDEKYVFEGMVFENSEKGIRSLWSLFLSTVYHLATHAAISDYSIYEQWRKHKTDYLCQNIIDFIEDVRVEKHLANAEPEIWENMTQMNSILMFWFAQDVKQQNTYDVTNKLHFDYTAVNKKIEDLREKIRETVSDKNNENLLACANSLYKNRELLHQIQLPYTEQHDDIRLIKIEKEAFEFSPHGIFEENVMILDELWQKEQEIQARTFRKYRKHLKGLNFDAIIIPPGNLHAYSQLKSKTLPMLRRIRQQISQVSNLEDDPKIDEIGYVNMQQAIQAVASETQNIQIFDRDEMRRGEEAWVILVDSSASMKLKFDRIKEFAVCISEAANELTGRKSQSWAMFSFDNNFSIIKDFNDKYTDGVKARIGAMKTGGLSFLPDGLELANRILSADERERKYLFIITDGHPSGYEKIEERFQKTIKSVELSGVTLVAIGLSKVITRSFKNSAKGIDLKQMVGKFITAYRAAAADV